MAGEKILVLGGTGKAGICLLRELLFRNHATVVYCRNPSKLPTDLYPNPLLEVIKGEMTDHEALSTAISKSSLILSLLGPAGFDMDGPAQFATYFREHVFPLMRVHHVRRIFLMGTLSIYRPEDSSSIIRFLVVLLVRLVVPMAWRNIIAIEKLCAEDEEATRDIDWTVYRIAGIPGGCSEAEWKKDRNDGDVFVGYVGQKGWTMKQRRGALARWLVDAAEDGSSEWIGGFPAVSRLAGSKMKSD